jgi:hypothetical protein
MSQSPLEPYNLPPDKQALVDQCFLMPRPKLWEQRGEEHKLHNRVRQYGQSHPPEVIDAVLRSVIRAWENYFERSVNPNDFMRTTSSDPFEIVSLGGQPRGIVANRDIEAGQFILEDTPILVLPYEHPTRKFFLTLPRKAVEAILLLPNWNRQSKESSATMDNANDRLLDLLEDILSTNRFAVPNSSCGSLLVLLLKGSLFSYSDSPNVKTEWDNRAETLRFLTLRKIKKGEELEVESSTRGGDLEYGGTMRSGDGESEEDRYNSSDEGEVVG